MLHFWIHVAELLLSANVSAGPISNDHIHPQFNHKGVIRLAVHYETLVMQDVRLFSSLNSKTGKRLL